MTKRNLLLVSLFLVFGLATMATTALAVTQFVPGSVPNGDGRAEGLAEETGQYTLTNNVAGTIAVGDYFTITYSVPAADVVPNSVFLQCSGEDFSAAPPTSCYDSTNTFPVVTATQTGNTVRVTFVHGPYYIFQRTGDAIAVVIRINASAVFSAASCPNTITAVSVPTNSNTAGVYTISQTVYNSYLPVLIINCEPTLSLNLAPKDHEVRHSNGIEGQVLDCIGAKDLGPYDKSFCVNIDEEFANALTSYSFELASDPDATNGTTVILTLTGIPTLMTLEGPWVTTCGNFSSSDPDYCAGSSYVPTLSVDAGSITCTADSPVPTPPTQTCTVTFTVETEDNGNPENFDACFKYWTKGPIPDGYVQVWANVQKGPITPSTDIPLFTGYYELPAPGLSVVAFSDCQTVLLYPYVTDVASYDTGLAVANTTLDPFDVTPGTGGIPAGFPNLPPTYGRGTAVPQTGDCYFYIYSGGALSATYDTGAIIPGSVDAFYLSAVAPGTTGAYAIAVCEFQNAHGFAEIQFDAGLYSGYAINYLALVLPDPAFYHRSPAGDMLGESADAPYLIGRFFEKLLSGQHH